MSRVAVRTFWSRCEQSILSTLAVVGVVTALSVGPGRTLVVGTFVLICLSAGVASALVRVRGWNASRVRQLRRRCVFLLAAIGLGVTVLHPTLGQLFVVGVLGIMAGIDARG